ncbi:Glycerol-1-phosphate dehydrogenase [NAD(P)+] [Candidatus Methanobinarius endosymbioticus]|uniref:Glycerol-1-phosphate dehydrogenase [NAD(P)+] n=1 Tax=Candidatus Methanobinarius endosymbioticus TaxID=2006182 RepID=A0A366MDR7_9EURY|nr:Glycerol-1-phosphate dehydrogenase [NAD(P)+] [Candidatus Methanobinarius endosymbioticus]
MGSKKIQMPREVHIGSDVINDTGSICKDLRFSGNVLVVTGPNTLKIGANKAIESLENEDFSVEVSKITTATSETVEKLEEKLNDTSLIVGVGGGKVIDVTKMAASNAGIYFVSVPTAASHDGIASPLASIKNNNGSVSLKAQAPICVIGDTNIIRNAPFRLLAAGCADIISNYTAIKDWQLANKLQNDFYSESAAALSLMTAKLIIKSSKSIKKGLEESARLVVKSLFSSGMAISIAGSSRPASGSEHKFSHALDKIAKKPALHGEQCGIGTIMMMNLHGGDWQFIKNALNDMKAPTNAYDLGIDPDDIVDALTSAHTIRPERYTILGDRGLSRNTAKKLAIKTGVI